MKKELITHKDPKSPISEVIRTLRTNIQFMNTNKKLKTLLVTSTVPGEGKSWVASNLAVTFAQTQKKVVLIDADMRKGRQYVIFGTSPRPGLSNYLSQIEIDENENTSEDILDYIRETEVPNLYLMPAGNIPPNPSELLVSSQMTKLLDELKDIFDIIIIDGTPCELVTDSVILSRVVDSTIIVSAHKTTKKDDLERLIKNIQNVGGKLLGVVLNKIPVSNSKYEEKYYYYGEEPKMSNRQGEVKGRSSHNRTSVGTTKRSKTKEANRQRMVEAVNVNKREINPVKEKENNITENRELPKALEDIKLKNSEEISLERTSDILRQINEYLEQEKKNLNK